MTPVSGSSRASESPPRIVDVVFAVPPPYWPARAIVAVSVALAAHGSLWMWARSTERSLESWSAQLAARVHAELSRSEIIDLPKTEPPPPPPAPTPAPEQPSPRPSRPSVPQAKNAPPPPPAQAGKIVAQDPSAPVDFTGETFVTGTADAYAGGVTAANGTSKTAVTAATVHPTAPPIRTVVAAGPDRSASVSLPDQSWSCPWPREADAEDIDEQTVVIRVSVRPDGAVESASVVSDPGHGFGAAAVACAMRTRFTAARDRNGVAIRALSPPIRVRFTR